MARKVLSTRMRTAFASRAENLDEGRIKLQATNPTLPDIVFNDRKLPEVWGLITASTQQYRA